MNGPEHYTAAERLEQDACQPGLSPEWVMARLARAQVHATLALAAATAEGSTDSLGRTLVLPPVAESPIDPPYPGNEWGQAIHGGGITR